MTMKLGPATVQPGPIEKDWTLPDRSPGLTSEKPFVGANGMTTPMREMTIPSGRAPTVPAPRRPAR